MRISNVNKIIKKKLKYDNIFYINFQLWNYSWNYRIFIMGIITLIIKRKPTEWKMFKTELNPEIEPGTLGIALHLLYYLFYDYNTQFSFSHSYVFFNLLLMSASDQTSPRSQNLEDKHRNKIESMIDHNIV